MKYLLRLLLSLNKRRKANKAAQAAGTADASSEISKKSEISVEDGSTIIKIYFDIHIDANVVQQLNVNPQEVNNYMVSQITTLKEIVAKKIAELKETQNHKPWCLQSAFSHTSAILSE